MIKKDISIIIVAIFLLICSGPGFAETPQEPDSCLDLQTYPLNVGLDYYRYAVLPPDTIYNTTGSENGLVGLICTFDGAVEEILPMDADGIAVEYAKVKTEKGTVLILNMYQGIYRETVRMYGKTTAREIYSDNADYYTFPPIGERVSFLAVYDGYSTTEDMPFFLYGASADIFKIVGYDDPVAKELEEILNYNS